MELYTYVRLCMLASLNDFAHCLEGNAPQCIVGVTDVINACQHREFELATYYGPMGFSKNIILNITSSKHNSKKGNCKIKIVCKNIFKVLRIRQQSFQTKIRVQISDMIYKCCGNCTKYFMNDSFTDVANINQKVMKSFDFIFPITARSSNVHRLYGFYYIPVFEIPNAYYITLRKSKKEASIALILACLNMWPLIIICLLLSLMFGFIIWITERRRNVGQFDKRFHRGLFHGFWWSWVSMTTVGYGDKAPKTITGRLVAIICILFGITTFAISTASITTKVFSVSSLPDTDLSGKLVGTIGHRLHDSIIISQHGGVIQSVHTNSLLFGVLELIKRLKRGDISGFLINKAIYQYVIRVINKNEKLKSAYKQSIRNIYLYRTEKHFLGEKMVTGMLVKRKEDYELFKSYFESNWLEIQGCLAQSLNNKKNINLEPEYFMPFEGLLQPLLYFSLTLVGLMVLFGFVYEIRRKYVLTLTQEDD